MKRRVRVGPLEFCDPLLMCGILYVLLFLDSSGFLRLGLLAAFLHETGHIAVYCLLRRRFPVIRVTMTGFCMATRGAELTAGQTFWLAAAGPGVNLVLAAFWAAKMAQRITVWGSAFLAANLLTGAFNLLPIPPLDGAQMLQSLWQMLHAQTRN
ncbi:MAG: site-2 protease family protein [Faecalibacterium sp.]